MRQCKGSTVAGDRPPLAGPVRVGGVDLKLREDGLGDAVESSAALFGACRYKIIGSRPTALAGRRIYRPSVRSAAPLFKAQSCARAAGLAISSA
jgi:hypothetical protein